LIKNLSKDDQNIKETGGIPAGKGKIESLVLCSLFYAFPCRKWKEVDLLYAVYVTAAYLHFLR